jgi:hypothetical protein
MHLYWLYQSFLDLIRCNCSPKTLNVRNGAADLQCRILCAIKVNQFFRNWLTAWIVFARLDAGIESHSWHGCLVCVCVYSVFMLSCVQEATLMRVDHSSTESYRLWKMITELNKRPGPWMGRKSHWKKSYAYESHAWAHNINSFPIALQFILSCNSLENLQDPRFLKELSKRSHYKTRKKSGLITPKSRP